VLYERGVFLCPENASPCSNHKKTAPDGAAE
jgi:hypothetical protein